MKDIAHRALAATAMLLALVSNGPLMGCAPSRNTESTDEYIDDAAISAKVRAKILADPDIKISEIKVTTYRGTVQIGGYVADRQMMVKAEDDAKSVQGVTDVKNSLVIRRQ